MPSGISRFPKRPFSYERFPQEPFRQQHFRQESPLAKRLLLLGKVWIVFYRWRLAAITAVLIFLILFYRPLMRSFFLGLLLAFSVSPSLIKRRLQGAPIVLFELGTFSTVIVGAAYGAPVGALFGMIQTVTAALIERAFSPTLFISVIIAALTGIMGALLSTLFSLVWVGLFVLVFAALAGNGSAFLLQKPDAGTFLSAVIGTTLNLLVNIVLFAYFGAALLGILKGITL